MQPINLKLENIEKVVMATCVLHNFLRSKRGENYIPVNQSDTEDANVLKKKDNFMSLQKGHNRHTSESCKAVRDLFKNYFYNEGAYLGKKITFNLKKVSFIFPKSTTRVILSFNKEHFTFKK